MIPEWGNEEDLRQALHAYADSTMPQVGQTWQVHGGFFGKFRVTLIAPEGIYFKSQEVLETCITRADWTEQVMRGNLCLCRS